MGVARFLGDAEAPVTDIIIHIGYHKTGTTWFQNNFYPALHEAKYVPRDYVARALISPRALVFDPVAAREIVLSYFAGGNPGQLILCEEGLSGNPHFGGYHGCLTKVVADRIYETFPGAKIVIFIRNQIDIIASAYSEYIKAGGTYPIEKYLFIDRYIENAQPQRIPQFSFDHFDYNKLVEYYCNLFGDKKVFVFVFEGFFKDLNSSIINFCNLLNIRADIKGVDMGAKNISLSLRLMSIMRFVNRFSAGGTTQKNYLLNIPGLKVLADRLIDAAGQRQWFGPRGTSEELLGAETLQYIRDHFHASNLQLSIRLGTDLRTRGYP